MSYGNVHVASAPLDTPSVEVSRWTSGLARLLKEQGTASIYQAFAYTTQTLGPAVAYNLRPNCQQPWPPGSNPFGNPRNRGIEEDTPLGRVGMKGLERPMRGGRTVSGSAVGCQRRCHPAPTSRSGGPVVQPEKSLDIGKAPSPVGGSINGGIHLGFLGSRNVFGGKLQKKMGQIPSSVAVFPPGSGNSSASTGVRAMSGGGDAERGVAGAHPNKREINDVFLAPNTHFFAHFNAQNEHIQGLTHMESIFIKKKLQEFHSCFFFGIPVVTRIGAQGLTDWPIPRR